MIKLIKRLLRKKLAITPSVEKDSGGGMFLIVDRIVDDVIFNGVSWQLLAYTSQCKRVSFRNCIFIDCGTIETGPNKFWVMKDCVLRNTHLIVDKTSTLRIDGTLKLEHDDPCTMDGIAVIPPKPRLKVRYA